MAKPDLTIEAIRRADHDMLIKLDGKVDQLIESTKRGVEGVASVTSNHEGRISTLEKMALEANVPLRLKQIDEMYAWKHDFSLTWKMFLGMSSAVGAIVSFLLANIGNLIHLFTK